MIKFIIFLAIFLSHLLLFSCGGGDSNSDQTPINTNVDQNKEVDNSSQNTVSASVVTAPTQIEVVNRFGMCDFGECRFE